jgi:imidazolonepropionase
VGSSKVARSREDRVSAVTLRVISGGRDDVELPGLLVVGAREVVTMAGGPRMGSAQGDVARLNVATVESDARDQPGGARIRAVPAASADDPAIAAWEGRLLAVAGRADLERLLVGEGYRLDSFAVIDAQGGTVTPGLVDPHTHLLFAGSREAELELRQQGASYLEILQAGGGILSTVEATRLASPEDLAAHGRRWLDEMLSHGVTTVEAKSGYGLDLATELRLLDVAYQLGTEGPVDVVPTWLGAHAVPPELRGRPDATEQYVKRLLGEQLPGIAAQGRAVAADVFCEEGVFSADQSRRILEAAAAYGLRPRLHADELAPSGGAELAAEIGATSADHLATPSPAGIDALAAVAADGRPVVATLLPATTWFLMKEHHAPARTLIDRGIPVAIGTDFNPGTSPTPSLPLAMTAACLNLRMTPDEVLAAVTINAALALGLADEIGSIETGKQADLVVWNVPTSRQIPYWPAADLVRTVVKKGRVVLDRA